jgi:hypothetical protein
MQGREQGTTAKHATSVFCKMCVPRGPTATHLARAHIHIHTHSHTHTVTHTHSHTHTHSYT